MSQSITYSTTPREHLTGLYTPWVHQLYGHLPLITKTIQVRRTRHAGHSWRSRDELICDVLLWTLTHSRAKAGRPARTYIQQLCGDTGCCPEDLPEEMNYREKWRERVRDIRVTSTTWWWWWWWWMKYEIVFKRFNIEDTPLKSESLEIDLFAFYLSFVPFETYEIIFLLF